ncbi:hypothetical protein CC1G_04638 [Coprinopsis cinerea okayama7|uniref:Uncharacterized protein n=1 Tax=Coprinopsis cinerea (strain Okayama-7 / 130 / ATCC MYA-4618 / FGSC 9003) TaxID=240176 RepID=A8N4U9_COPC7|nr:hypothetical protein CC1G_04638 [Coprinopsis cinerea okayama7\|eukprot:XP_001829949.1 hypothetical protein CC1G_04638 [Coprinopsis cinerea okayama7\
MVSPYVPHALYAIAVTSISIHIVGHKRESEEERTRYESRISILEQIRDHLRNPNSTTSKDEIERLKRLARPLKEDPHADGRKLPEVEIGWRDVWFGRKLPKEDEELSEWDKKDLERLKEAFKEEKA